MEDCKFNKLKAFRFFLKEQEYVVLDQNGNSYYGVDKSFHDNYIHPSVVSSSLGSLVILNPNNYSIADLKIG